MCSKIFLVVAFLVLSGCSVGLDAPGDLVITCDSNTGCPVNYACDTAAGRCFDTRISLPRVFVEPVARGYGDVPLSITVSDNDADTATVTGELSVDGGEFGPAAIDGDGLTTTRAGVQHVIVWHAGDDLGGNGYRANVRLRLTAADRGGRGAPVITEPFAVGDDAPVVSSVSVDGSGALSGNIIVRYDVADDSSDPVAIERFEVSYDGRFTAGDVVVIYDAAAPDPSTIPSGALVGIESSPAGVAGSFTWYSEKSLVDAPRAKLRLTLRDAFLSAAPAESATFYLRTQQPPRLVGLRAPAASERIAAGPIAIGYRLIDDDNEPANVVFEYSLDGGLSFKVCNEYPVDQSEGIFGLAATSEATGGVEHVFVWDTTGAGNAPSDRVVLRARADTPTDLGQSIGFPQGVGAPHVAPYDVRFTSGNPGLPAFPEYALGDIDGDGEVDALLGRGQEWFLAYGQAPFPTFGGLSRPELPGANDIRGVALADLNEDGGADLVLTRGTSLDLGLTTVTLGVAAPGATATAQTLPAASDTLVVGDFDGDGHADIVAAAGTTVSVLFGDGHGALTAPTNLTVAGLVLQTVAVGHASGRVARDLWAIGDAGNLLVHLRATGDRAAPFSSETLLLPAAQGLLAIADLDADGNDDVLTSQSSTFASYEYRVTGAGALLGPQLVPTSFSAVSRITAGDVDGDGRAELAYLDQQGSTIFTRVRFNIGDSDGFAVFGEPVSFGSTSNTGDARMGFAYAPDGRGLLVAEVDNVVVSVLKNPAGLGNGAVYTPPRTYWNDARGYGQYAIADVDGDGIEDHLAFYGDIHLWRGSGVRGLASGILRGPEIVKCDACLAFAVGDANDDGLADLWVNSTTGYFVRIGNGDGTFAAATPSTSTAPAGFKTAQRVFPVNANADFDGDGIYDRSNYDGALRLRRGVYDAAGPTPDGPSSYDATSYVNWPMDLEPYNDLFIVDANDDGLADVVQSTAHGQTVFGIFFGQVEDNLPRTTRVLALAAKPTGKAAVSAIATDLIGERVAFHIARIATDDIAHWQRDLVSSGLVPDTAVALTAPYEVRGDRRMIPESTALPGTPSQTALHLEPRLGARTGTGTDFTRAGLDLSAGSNRGLVIDIPALPYPNDFASAANHVFLRVTDYAGLERGIPRRSSRWIRLPLVTDLATGSGPRYAVVEGQDGNTVFRVFTDRGGIIQAYKD